jgi:hypothetical protein
MFEDFISFIPEEKREAFTELSRKVLPIDDIEKHIISDEERLKRLLDVEPVRKIRQSEVDKRNQLFIDKFHAEKLPVLLEEERKKGQKSPVEIELDKLREELQSEKREKAIEKQKTRAISTAQAAGIPLAIIEKFIGETDEQTDENLKQLINTVTDWRNKAVQEALEKVGSQLPPKAGTGGKSMTIQAFQKLKPTEQSAYMKSGGQLIE